MEEVCITSCKLTFVFTEGLFIFTCGSCCSPLAFRGGKRSPWSHHGVPAVMLMDP